VKHARNVGEKFLQRAHPIKASSASTDQRDTKHTRGNSEMTKIASLTAAFILFAPLAVAIMLQAAQIIA